MIFGPQAPWPQIQQIAVSESELIYVLDSVGRITIINKDLNNQENGIIFVHKQSLGTRQFFLLSEVSGIFKSNDPVDQV